MRRGHRHRCRRLRRRRRHPPEGRGQRVREVRSTEGPCHRRVGQRAARPRRRPGACTGPGHRSPQPRGQSALRLSAPAGTSGRGRHMSTCLHCPMSSRASARFPTALAGTKPCAEAWEGLRRGLGGTAVLRSSGFTAVARALWEPMRQSRATFTMRSSHGLLEATTSAPKTRAPGPAPDGTCSTDGPVGPARPALHSPDSGGVNAPVRRRRGSWRHPPGPRPR